MEPKIGYHTSSAGGYFKAVERSMTKYNLEVFQFFLGSPRTWSFRDLKKNEIEKFQTKMAEAGYDNSIVHLNYLANPCTPEEDRELREKTLRVFEQEVQRSDQLGVDYLVFHINSHKGRGYETVKPNIVGLLDHLQTLDPQVTLLLETSAGQTNQVGSKFEEVGDIIQSVEDPSNIGVCFDTCHVFAAGYDLRSYEAVDDVMQKFEEHIGLEFLKVVHANDSKAGLGAGKDRHANIGHGHIGVDGFDAMLSHETFEGKPFVLETPGKHIMDDIRILKDLRNKHYR